MAEFYLLARIVLLTRFFQWIVISFYTAYQGPILREADAFPPQRFYPLLTQKVALCTDPKLFLKASLVPIYTIFEEGALAQKRDFWLKFQKSAVNDFFGLFRSMQYLKSQIFMFCLFYCFKNLRVAISKFQLKFQFEFYLLIHFSQIGLILTKKCPSQIVVQNQRVIRPSVFFRQIKFLSSVEFFSSVSLRLLLFPSCQLAILEF